MKVVHSKNPLPRDWSGMPGMKPALLQADISVLRSSRLRMKLVVFRTMGDMRRWWGGMGSGGLGSGCLGFVNALAYEEHMVDDDGSESMRRMTVDPRYFAVMGLTKGNLDAEIMAHEAAHAGFAYAKRVKLRNLWAGSRENDEEDVAYPAGIIAGKVVKVLRKAGLAR
jgi:hypothetical protein